MTTEQSSNKLSIMKELIREREFRKIGYFDPVLRSEGIDTFIKNQHSASSALDLPEFWPALCVVNNEDYEKAIAIIHKVREENAEDVDKSINCPKCNEANPGNFEICWSCGESLPD